jgi:hypothetical protein
MSTILTAPKRSLLADSDMQATHDALIRAAQNAREIAARTHTPLVINKNGKLVEEMVQPTFSIKKK